MPLKTVGWGKRNIILEGGDADTTLQTTMHQHDVSQSLNQAKKWGRPLFPSAPWSPYTFSLEGYPEEAREGRKLAVGIRGPEKENPVGGCLVIDALAMGGGLHLAEAERICRAVNGHEELIPELVGALEPIEKFATQFSFDDQTDDNVIGFTMTLGEWKKIALALTKAKEQGYGK
ncbi:hypothetical protein [Armatimonas sp.]|uniref:hypothetical protein n=1 Tax=Armatimonas sp. TaxID=1872638 RepID=UPI00374DE258